MNMQKRNLAIDGLKGLAILIVVIHHFALAFYPSIISGLSQHLHTKDMIEIMIFKTPLSIFFAGYFAVSLFFLITGYILTKKSIANIENKTYISSAIFNRIFRLMPLIAIVLFVGLALSNLHLTLNTAVNLYTRSGWLASFYPPGKVTVWGVIVDIFTHIPFVVSAGYYNVLWIIPNILFGSWFVYAASYILHESKIRFGMYLILLLALYNTPYVSFLFGMIIAENEEKIQLHKVVLYLGLFFSLMFGSSTVKALDFKILAPYAIFFKALSAALFFLAFTKIGWLNGIAQFKIFTYLGRNSYYYYLTHMLALITLASFVFLQLIPFSRYYEAVLAAFIVYWIGTVVYSIILKKSEVLITRWS